MGSKKRRRSESFQAEQGGDDDARKRLAAFHARMFDLPQEEATVATPETPQVLFKSKKKKHKRKFNDVDDGEPVPMVKFNKVKSKKEKKKVAAVKVEKVTGPAVVKVPGLSTVKSKTKEKVTKKKVKSDAVQVVKKPQVNTCVSAPQWHSLGMQDGGDDGMDPLEQALGSMKEIATKQVAKPLKKKHKSVTEKQVALKTDKVKKGEEPVEKKAAASSGVVECNVGGAMTKTMTKKQKKKQMKKLREKLKKLRSIKAGGSKIAAESPIASAIEAKSATAIVSENVTGSQSVVKTAANDTTSSTTSAPSPKAPSSRKKRKKSKMKDELNSKSPKTQESAQPRQGKSLIISDKREDRVVKKPKSLNDTTTNKVNVPSEQGTTAIKKKMVALNEGTQSTKPLTPIAASLAKDAKKNVDMFLPSRESSHQPTTAPKRIEKVVSSQVVRLPDDSSSSESDEDGGYDFNHDDGDETSLFSRLIDSAARERWELVEVGRLVRLFAAEWGFKESKTARFLLDTCPELVSVDFLEGLGVNLSSKQLVQVFEAGSGNSGVLMNKIASAVENGHLSVRDSSFVSALERRVSLMESNDEVMELLHPLLESLSTVRDVGCLLKQLCEHWQLERKHALVQQVLLSNVFDDLDGNQDEILLDLPDLTGRLDFPSRLDQEDVDENGNLKGFLANEDSDFSGEEGSEDDEVDDEDSEDDEDPYDGETDSEDEVEISGRSRGRNQFIEDEADVGEEDEEDEEEEEEDDKCHNDGSSSSSDSD
ncbi:hypothetical protein PHPALM_28808 [Phytophthora palmivora]|uniref:Uncharacterized protein n=1 Tax=Phytophthora palmivora TaxID=4796 RepID=A0A2P4X951_9STRA|nr:hypothetical protein PHPALM_28808 [Phytophthora palmivora]